MAGIPSIPMRLKMNYPNTTKAFIYCIVASTSFLLSDALPQVKAPAPHLNPENRSLWSDAEIGIRFTYPSVWQRVTPTQDSTRGVISWRLSKSKSLLATCYVEVHSAGRSQIGKLTPAEIKASAKKVAEASLKNMQLRAADATLLTWQNAVQDGHPVVYLVKQGNIESFDGKRRSMKVYAMMTAWRGNEVNFECGTTIFGSEYTQIEGGEHLVSQVEEGIFNVMRTLQFDRDFLR